MDNPFITADTINFIRNKDKLTNKHWKSMQSMYSRLKCIHISYSMLYLGTFDVHFDSSCYLLFLLELIDRLASACELASL